MIMTHGKNQSINVDTDTNAQFTSTGDGKTNISGKAAPNIQDLPTPKADLRGTDLLIYACHSADSAPKAHGEGDHAQGNLKGTKDTVASAFAKTFNFNSVTGTAGSVNYNSFMTNGTPAWSGSYLKPYPESGTWVKMSTQRSLQSPKNSVKR